jgi:hypothetical protein
MAHLNSGTDNGTSGHTYSVCPCPSRLCVRDKVPKCPALSHLSRGRSASRTQDRPNGHCISRNLACMSPAHARSIAASVFAPKVARATPAPAVGPATARIRAIFSRYLSARLPRARTTRVTFLHISDSQNRSFVVTGGAHDGAI